MVLRQYQVYSNSMELSTEPRGLVALHDHCNANFCCGVQQHHCPLGVSDKKGFGIQFQRPKPACPTLVLSHI